MCEAPAHFGKFNEVRPEQAIYHPLIQFLYLFGAEHFRPRHGTVQIFAEDISQVPAQQAGMWTRPDVAAVCVTRAKFAPSKTLNLMSFEVKSYDGTDISSVHQALAQARFVNNSYLVWNRPFCVCDDDNYKAIRLSCETHGIGLVVVHDPDNLRTFEFRVAPKRYEISPDALDEFVETRFSQRTKQTIVAAL